MDFNKWLSGAIKHAELSYIYTESVRGVGIQKLGYNVKGFKP